MKAALKTAFESALAWLKANVTLARLPLPMLALTASYGVYQFTLLFVPWWVAVASAAAFEFTYLGLSTLSVASEEQRRRATWISLGAVGVSVIYNFLAGLLHRNPEWLVGLDWWWEWLLALLHGAPLAIVAYLVADLLLHQGPGLLEELQTKFDQLAEELKEALEKIATLGKELAQAQQERIEAEGTWNETAARLQQELEAERQESARAREESAAVARQLEALQKELAETTASKAYTCPYCQREFATPQALGGHKGSCSMKPELVHANGHAKEAT